MPTSWFWTTLMILTLLPGALVSQSPAQAPGGADQAADLGLGKEIENPGPQELAATQMLVQIATGQINAMTNPPFQRDQHPKSPAGVRATFEVSQKIPNEMKFGIFSEPRTYQAIIRFSNGGSQKDNEKDAHGMAIKLLGVEGKKELDAEKYTQDFILVDHPVFFAIDPPNLLQLLPFIKELAAAKDPATAGEVFKRLAEKFPRQAAILAQFKKLGTPSHLEMKFFSEVPYKLDSLAVKYRAIPFDENTSGRAALTEDSSCDAFRKAMVDRLKLGGKPAKFSFQIIPQQDPKKHPVEDPTVEWTETPITVATITIVPQVFDTPECDKFVEDLAMTPWHSLKVHRPLGGINRARKAIYEATSNLRRQKNGRPPQEPTVADLDKLFKTN